MAIISPESDARARKLCNQLAIHRLARGLTQRDMAAHFRDQQSNVQTIEVMARRPVLPTFVAYAWALGLEVALVPEHVLPLLDLTADEIEALHAAADLYMDSPGYGHIPHLRSALDKLTTTEETPDA